MQFAKNFTNVVIFLGIFFALISTQSASAQNISPPTDDEVNAIAKELYCPVCENTPLDVCPTQACAQWRDMIREKLSQGFSADEIKEYFVNQYGDRVLAEPPRRGLNWLVYILPPMFFLGGVVLVYRSLRNAQMNKSLSTLPEKIDDSDPYLKEMEEALKIFDKQDKEQ